MIPSDGQCNVFVQDCDGSSQIFLSGMEVFSTWEQVHGHELIPTVTDAFIPPGMTNKITFEVIIECQSKDYNFGKELSENCTGMQIHRVKILYKSDDLYNINLMSRKSSGFSSMKQMCRHIIRTNVLEPGGCSIFIKYTVSFWRTYRQGPLRAKRLIRTLGPLKRKKNPPILEIIQVFIFGVTYCLI